MQSGELTVTGNGSSIIPLAGRPREVLVRFKHEYEREHVPCNHHHHDHLEYKIISEDEDPRTHHKISHHHHDRLFFLVVEWQVDGIREIDWFILY